MPANIVAGAEKDEQPSEARELPIGIEATGKRIESDSLGEVEVPANHYWALRPSDLSFISPSATTACRRRSTTLMDAAMVNAAAGTYPDGKRI